jgi:hypothetical protein
MQTIPNKDKVFDKAFDYAGFDRAVLDPVKSLTARDFFV